MSRTETLFLYGSLLQRTGHNHIDRIMSRFSRTLYRGYIHGKLYDLGPYPGAVESVQLTDRVFGMLVELSRASLVLPQLDKYEDYQQKQLELSQYLRKQVEVHMPGKDKTEMAWCYIYNQPVNEDRWIRSGDWLAWLKNRST